MDSRSVRGVSSHTGGARARSSVASTVGGDDALQLTVSSGQVAPELRTSGRKKGASREAAPVTVTCVKCQEECPVSETNIWGSSDTKRICRPCSCTLTAVQRHSKKNPEISRALKRKSDADKVAFMREMKQQRRLSPGAQYSFQSLIGHQSQSTESATIDDSVTKWEPFREWLVKEKIIDPTLTTEAAKVRFKTLIANGVVRHRWINGQICIAEHGGGETRERNSRSLVTSISRARQLSGNDEAHMFGQQNQQLHQQRRQSMHTEGGYGSSASLIDFELSDLVADDQPVAESNVLGRVALKDQMQQQQLDTLEEQTLLQHAVQHGEATQKTKPKHPLWKLRINLQALLKSKTTHYNSVLHSARSELDGRKNEMNQLLEDRSDDDLKQDFAQLSGVASSAIDDLQKDCKQRCDKMGQIDAEKMNDIHELELTIDAFKGNPAEHLVFAKAATWGSNFVFMVPQPLSCLVWLAANSIPKWFAGAS